MLAALPALDHYQYTSGDGSYTVNEGDGDSTTHYYKYIDIERISGTTTAFDVVLSNPVTVASITNDISTLEVGAAGQSRARILYELGDQTVANATLLSELDFADAPQRWTTDHVGQRVTWINVRWPPEWLRDTLGRVPAVTAVLKGNAEIVDTRNNSVGYSTNAALCARWVAQRSYSLSDSQLPNADWNAAANVADENVPVLGGGTEKRYTVNGVVSTGLQPIDRLKVFVDSMQAPFMRRGHEVIMRPAQWSAPMVALDENDLVGNVSVMHQPAASSSFNLLQGVFTNPDQEWQDHDYPSIVIDNGLPEKVGNLPFPLVISAHTAQRLAKLNLVLQSNAAPVRVTIKRLPVYISADTMISLTYPALGWVNKSFYVDSRRNLADSKADLILLPREASQYAWSASDAVAVDSVSSQLVFSIRTDLS